MTLPVGISTCTVTLGKALDVLGNEATIQATVTPDRALVWSATGDTLYDVSPTVTSGAFASLSFVLPHVDQDGFVDSAGDAVTNWSYRIKATVFFPDSSQQSITKDVQVFVGQTSVDLDLVPDGVSVPGVTAPAAAVLSVAGQTGVVTSAELLEALGEFDVSAVLPAGGTTGQVLGKASSADGDVEWVDQTGGGGGGGGTTNLSASRTSTTVTVASDTGTDATLAAADGTNAGVMTSAMQTKLAGIATSATANDTDANLKARANHTGTQAISTVTGLQTALDGKVAGTGITAIVSISQEDYDALGTPAATTLYVITG